MWFLLCVLLALQSVAKASDNTVNLKNVEAAVASLEEKLNLCQESSRTLGEKYDSLENKLNSLDQFDALNNVITENKNGIQNMQKKVNALNSENLKSSRTLEEKYDSLENKLNSLDQFDALNNVITENKNGIQNMQKKVNALNSENLKSSRTLGEKYDSLENTLNNQQGNMESLTKTISKLEKSIGKGNKKNQNSMTNLNKSLEDLDKKLKKKQQEMMNKSTNGLEKTIDALKQQLGTYNAKILEQSSLIKKLSEQQESTLKRIDELENSASEYFGHSLIAQVWELKVLITEAYFHVMQDVLIRMGFDPDNLEESGRQLKKYFNTTCEKFEEAFEQSKILGFQGIEYLSVLGSQGFVYMNVASEKIPVWTESFMSRTESFMSTAQSYGEVMHSHGSEYAAVIKQKASEITQLASEKANEISLEDIKQTSFSAAENAQKKYYAGKNYVSDTFPQVKEVFDGARTQVSGLGVVSDPADVELIIDVTIILTLIIVSYIFLRIVCCLVWGSCWGKKGKRKKASKNVVNKVEQAKKELGKKKKKKSPSGKKKEKEKVKK